MSDSHHPHDQVHRLAQPEHSQHSQQSQQSQQSQHPPTQQQPNNTSGSAAYKRASRKGAPRRYACRFPGCDKVYSRQEHLQRHQLNHSPKEIYACDVDGCGQRFVRADLLSRHKKRHSASYTPRNRIQSFREPEHATYTTGPGGNIISPPVGLHGNSRSGHNHNAIDDSPQSTSTGTPGTSVGTNVGHGHVGNTNVSGGVAGGGGFNTRITSYPSPSVPRDAAILLSPETSTVLPVTTSSMPVTASHVGLAGMPSHRPGAIGQTAPPPTQVLQAVSASWAASAPLATNMGVEMMQTEKTAGYYQAQTVTQHQHQQHHHIEQHHSQHQQQPHHQQHQPPQPQPQHQPYHQPHTRDVIDDPAPSLLAFAGATYADSYLSSENFTAWLFNATPAIHFNMSQQLPFLEGGLESPFNNNITYDYESLTSRSHIDTPPRQLESSDEAVTDARRQEIVSAFKAWRLQQPLHMQERTPSFGQVIGDDIPALSADMIHESLYEFWEHVSPRVPIIHQPTFSCNRCPLLLLAVMLALGSASRYDRDQTGTLGELGGFADIVITQARFEILTNEEATPPVSLWVAQALLLVEFYEKMQSTRWLHERSQVYHSVTLTLLRRGSPLIGRGGSETPPDESQLPPSLTATSPPSSLPTHPQSPPTPLSHQPLGRHHHHPHPHGHAQRLHHHHQRDGAAASGTGTDLQTWWTRWAETEAMHRVVFVTFCLDIAHASMFGHMADMAPHEIRLPLPCGDNQWTAPRPEDVRQIDHELRMYGAHPPIMFLDGLKQAVHGIEVKTHSFGRMIIMSGLLSVGWHLRNRETHLKWLDLTSTANAGQGSTTETAQTQQDAWRKTLLTAFDGWKNSFDQVQGAQGPAAVAGTAVATTAATAGASTATTSSSPSSPSPTIRRSGFNGPIESAAVLYHLAHICLHVDIVDCQVFAGAKRLLSRKVSSRDYTNVVTRMTTWAKQASTRHAVLHAFRLLYRVLAHPGGRGDQKSGAATSTAGPSSSMYSLKTEADPHRPWIMYYAALSIWSFVRAVGQIRGAPGRTHTHGHAHSHLPPYQRVVAYLARVAERHDLDEVVSHGFDHQSHHQLYHTLADGLPDLLDYLQAVFAEAHSELLREAHQRLQVCLEIIMGQ